VGKEKRQKGQDRRRVPWLIFRCDQAGWRGSVIEMLDDSLNATKRADVLFWPDKR
jgi:hypothetical protein